MSDRQDPTVSEGEESRVEEVRAVLRVYLFFIDEYQKAICVQGEINARVEGHCRTIYIILYYGSHGRCWG